MENQQEDPLEKLYGVVSSKKLYTKSFDEFKSKYSTDVEVNKIFEVVSREKLYTKDINSFKDKYFASLGKQKEGSSKGLQNTSQNGKLTSQISGLTDQALSEGLLPKLDTDFKPQLGRDSFKANQNKSKIIKEMPKAFLPFAPKEFSTAEFDANLQGIGAPIMPSNPNIEESQGIGGKEILDSKKEVSTKTNFEQQKDYYVDLYKGTNSSGYKNIPAQFLAATSEFLVKFTGGVLTGVRDIQNSITNAENLTDNAPTDLSNPNVKPQNLIEYAIRGLDNTAAQYEALGQSYQLPDDVAGQTTKGIIDAIPLIMSLAGGAGEAKLLSNANVAIGKLISENAFNPLTKTLTTQGFVSTYGNERAQGKTTTQSLTTASEAGAQGFKSGLELTAMGGLANRATPAILEGLMLKGFTAPQTVEKVTHALVMGISGGGVSVAEDLSQGNEIDTDKAIQQFALFTAFGLGAIGKSIANDVTKGISQGINKIGDYKLDKAVYEKAQQSIRDNDVLAVSATRSFLGTDINTINIINKSEGTHQELQGQSLEFGMKALEVKERDGKVENFINQDRLQKMSDIKFVTENIVNNKEAILKSIDEMEIADEAKQAYKEKIEAVYENNAPKEIAKQAIAGEILEKTGQSKKLDTTIKNSKDPIEVSKARIEKEKIDKSLEELNTNLDNLNKDTATPQQSVSTDVVQDTPIVDVPIPVSEVAIPALKDVESAPQVEIPKNIIEAFKGGEKGITAGKQKALENFRKAGGKATSGLNVEQAAYALEYAILSIADGTIKTAKALKKAFAGYEFKGKEIDDIFYKAQTIAEEYKNSGNFDQAKINKRLGDLATFIQAKIKNPNEKFNDAEFEKLKDYARLLYLGGQVTSAKEFQDFVGVENTTVREAYERVQQERTNAYVERLKGKQPTTKDVIQSGVDKGTTGQRIQTMRQAIKDFYTTLGQGVREGLKQGREKTKEAVTDLKEGYKNIDAVKIDLRKQITDIISAAKKAGTFRGDIKGFQASNLLKTLNRAETLPELLDAIEYAEKYIKDVEYDKKVRRAIVSGRGLSNLAEGKAKKQTDIRPLLKELAKMAKTPSKIVDIDGFLKITENNISKEGSINVSVKEMQDFIKTELEAQGKQAEARQEELAADKKAKEIDHITKLLTEAGLDESEAFEYWDAMVTPDAVEVKSVEDIAVEKENPFRKKLEQIIEFNKEQLKEPTKENKEMFEALVNTDTSKFTNQQLKELNMAITNATVNGDFITGRDRIIAEYQAQVESKAYVSKFESEIGKVRQGTSEQFFDIAPDKSKPSTDQMFRLMSSSPTMGRELHEIIMSPVESAYVVAKSKVDRKVDSAVKIYEANKLKLIDNTRIGVSLFLGDIEVDVRGKTDQEIFNEKKSLLTQTRDLLARVLLKEKANLHSVDFKKYTRELEHLNQILPELETYTDVDSFREKFLNDKQKPLRDFILDSWSKDKGASKEYYKSLGIGFTEVQSFAPISYSSVVTNATVADANYATNTFIRAGSVDEQGRFVAERKNVTILPKGQDADGNTIQRYVSLDAIGNFNREYKRRTIDRETYRDRVKATKLISDPEIKRLLDRNDEVSNYGNIAEKTKLNIRDLLGGATFKKDFAFGLDKLINQTTIGGFYRTAVGTVTQYGTQVFNNIPTIIANSSPKAFYQSSALLIGKNNNAVARLMEKSGAVAFARISESSNDFLNRLDRQGDTENSPVLNKVDKFNKSWNDISFASLKKGDEVNTKNAWLAGYIKSLVDQGVIKTETDFNLEMLEKSVTSPNREAVKEADYVAKKVNGDLLAASKGAITQSRSTATRALNVLFGTPLKSFSIRDNIEAKISFMNVMQREYTGHDVAVLSAYVTKTFVLSSAIKWGFNAGFTLGGNAIASYLVGGEDKSGEIENRRLEKLNLLSREELESLKAKKLTPEKYRKELIRLNGERETEIKNTRKVYAYGAQAVSSVLLGSKAAWLESVTKFGVDQVYSHLVDYYYSKGIKGEQDKSTLPTTLFYTSAENPIGLGVMDFGVSLVNNVNSVGKALPVDETMAKKIEYMRYLNIVAGVANADAKRLSQQVLRKMEEQSKDDYFKTSEKYTFVKKAIEDFKLKPIPVFNGTEVYMEQKDGRVKGVDLTKEDIKFVNDNIPKEFFKLVKDFGFGGSSGTMRKYADIKFIVGNGDGVDTANKAIRTAYDRAKQIVLEKRFKGTVTTEKNYEEQ